MTSFKAISWVLEHARFLAREAGAHRSDGEHAPASPPLPSSAMEVDLREHWSIGGVEIPCRLVLAPMAGVSVQAFRRQGRRYGAGLVCSEMVSVAGIQHRNERTLGYLRVAVRRAPARDPDLRLRPGRMAEAARMVVAAGADIVDINFGCPVRKVTKTGAGASLLDDHDLAARIVEAVAAATSLPVTVKMRRGTATARATASSSGPASSRPGPRRSRSTRARRSRCTPAPPTTAHRRARRAGRRSRDRLRRRHLARSRPGGARDDRRRRGHGRPGRPGEPVDARADHGRRRRADPRAGRRRARALHPRDGARARRAACHRLPAEVLRLVSRARAFSEAVQAGARHPGAPSRRSSCACSPPPRAPASSSTSWRRRRRPSRSCCSTRSRSPPTAAVSRTRAPRGRAARRRWRRRSAAGTG